ncbi:tetratricopeptide repeat protein [Ktedonobacter racemifer]|nr:tetratricopeptide repeat protein [Ktedonobacter racemifer]
MMDNEQDTQNSGSGNNTFPLHFVSREEMREPDPADGQAWTDRGNNAAANEDYETAAECFERAVAADPEDARARYNLALAQQYLGDTELAIAGYRRAIDLDPNLIDSYINLGNLYGEIGMYEESLETFQQGLELDPQSDELYLSVGDTYRLQNLYRDAIQAYRQALMLNPDNTLAADNLRDVRERVNDQYRRMMEQERRIDEDPADPTRYAELASIQLDMHRYDEALSLANQMIALDPQGRAGYDMLAAVYEQMGDAEQAAEIYQRIANQYPEDPDAWEKLGFWRSLQDRTNEAIVAYERAVELDAQRTTARFSLAEAYLEADRYADALPIYQNMVDTGKGLLQDDDLAAAFAGLAEAYNSLGRHDEAMRVSHQLLERFEDDPEGYYQLAVAYDGLNRPNDAIENYLNAIDADPLNADYYNDLADTLLTEKRYDEALEYVQQAIAMDPSLTVAYETLAQVYDALGRGDEAEEARIQARELRSATGA